MILLREPRFTWFGRLTNEYLVDAMSRIEDHRLAYIRFHLQGRLSKGRAGCETIDAEGGPRKGKVYLPASFIGSTRNMRALRMDALEIVRHYGKPSPPKFPLLVTLIEVKV